MLELIYDKPDEYLDSVFENVVMFSSVATLLKQIPIPKYLQSITPQCESTLTSRERKPMPGKLLIINVTVALPKDEKKTKPSSSSDTPVAASPEAEEGPKEIKPNIVIAPIKVSPLDDIKFDLIDTVFEKLGGACSDALLKDSAKPGDVVGIRVSLPYFGISKKQFEQMATKHLVGSKLTMRVFA